MENIPNNIKKKNYISYDKWVNQENKKIIEVDKKYKLIKKENLQKANIIKINGKYYSLKKGKKMPIGTISNGQKKVAEGKWVSVGEGKDKNGNLDIKKPGKEKPVKNKDAVKQDKKEKSEKKKPGKEKSVKNKDAVKQDAKEKLKNTLKKIATILADALSGKDVVQPSGQAVEEVGESAKRKTKIKKQEKSKKKEEKPKEKEKK